MESRRIAEHHGLCMHYNGIRMLGLCACAKVRIKRGVARCCALHSFKVVEQDYIQGHF